MWKRSFCARPPSKSESWRCANEAFVQDLPPKVKVEELKIWKPSFRARLHAHLNSLWDHLTLISSESHLNWLWDHLTLILLCIHCCDIHSCDNHCCDIHCCDIHCCDINFCDIHFCHVHCCDIHCCDAQRSVRRKYRLLNFLWLFSDAISTTGDRQCTLQSGIYSQLTLKKSTNDSLVACVWALESQDPLREGDTKKLSVSSFRMISVGTSRQLNSC